MEPFWNHTMNLSIKNVAEEVVRRIRARAARNHRSLQGELLAIIETAAEEDEVLSVDDLLGEVRRLGLSTPEEPVALIRANRDG
jgi:plasmid stability protein